MTPDALQRLESALADRYRIEGEVGAGGMATVYLAHDLKHDRKVAIKMLRPELGVVIGADRFLKEIKTTANLQHPHILALIDSGEVNGLLWYAMPFVEGESLRQRLDREKQLPIADALRLASEVASALDYAHRHGVIHRDVKPENILLHDGTALVADFGIALAASSAGGRMTETGMSLGTPQYMSPEQAMGEREITARSDVFALGCVVYEMLVGDPPFTGSTAQAIVARVMTEAPRALVVQRHTIPDHVDAAVLTSLEKLPADRFASTALFAEALSGARVTAAGTRAHAARARPGRAARILPWALLGAAAVAIAVLVSRRSPSSESGGQVVRAVLELPPGYAISYSSLAVAHDGSRIVVAARYNGQAVLVQRELAALDFTPVAGSLDALHPFFSPDARAVVFAAGQVMRRVPLDGSPASDMTPSSWAGGDWTASGLIVFPPDYLKGLWRVPATGGTATVVTVPDSAHGELAHWWPQVLPDGDHVIFTAFRTPASQASIDVVSMKSGKRSELIRGGLTGRYVSPGYLLYARNEALFAAPFDLAGLKVTGPAVAVVQDLAMETGSGLAGFAVSDNGTLVYIPASTYAPDRELAWVSRHGDATAPITQPARMYTPAAAPDGGKVAVAISHAGEPRQVWIVDLARHSRSALTAAGSNSFAPIFTPAGDRVVFEVERPVFDLYQQKIDGSNAATPLVVSPYDKVATAITPDGRTLLFEQRLVPHTEIWSVPLEGGKAVPLLKSAAGDLRGATVSPDGRWLAYVSNESGRAEIYLSPYPAITAGRRQVSIDGGVEVHWTKHGKELVYLNDRQMMAVPVDPTSGSLGPATELFRGDFLMDLAQHRSFDVTADGERFLMIRRPGGLEAHQVIVVTNWFDELRRKMAK